jgi:HEAT repeat protein
MRTCFAILFCGFVAASGVPRGSGSELFLLYRDDHDQRVVAEVRARLDGRTVSLDVRAHGPDVEAPVGPEGFRGENLQTAYELERGLERGTIRFVTFQASGDRVDVVRRAPFRVREYDAARRLLVERDTVPRIRSLVYTAELTATESPRPLRLEVQVGGVPRLVLIGRQDPDGGVLLRFERFERYGPVESVASFAPQEPPGEEGTESVPVLVRRLGDDELEIRRDAARKLTARGPRIIPELERYAAEPNLEVRGAVQHVIHAIRLREAEKGLTGEDPEARAAAMARIAALEGKDIFKLIEENPDPKYIPALTDVVVYDYSTPDRGKAVEALMRIGTPKIYPALVYALRNPWNHGEPMVSWLSKNGDLTVLHEIEGEASKNVAMKMVAEELCARFPGEKSEKPKDWTPLRPATFLKAISDGSTVAERVRGIRGSVNSGDHGEALVRALTAGLDDPKEEIRFRSAEALVYTGLGKSDARVEELFKDEREALRVRQMAGLALARRSELMRIRLLKSLATGPSALRITVAGALGDSADPGLIKGLQEQAGRQEDAAVREAIEKAVERIRELNKKRP